MFLSVLLMYPVSVQAGDRDEVIEMEEIDLTTGEVSTYELPLYDDNEMCDAIDGFSGEVPEPISINGKYYVVAIHILGGSTYNTGRYVTKNIYELVNKYR